MPPSTLTANLTVPVHVAWWWPVSHVYFALLIAAMRLRILSDDDAKYRARVFVLSAVRYRIGDRGPWRPLRSSLTKGATDGN